jgi:hypothetical protein
MNFKEYLKTTTPLKLLTMCFEEHFSSLNYKKLSQTKFINNNISIELELNSQEPCIVLNDLSSNVITSYLFDPTIAFKKSAIIRTDRFRENYVIDDFLEPVDMYELLDIVTDKKEEMEIE